MPDELVSRLVAVSVSVVGIPTYIVSSADSVSDAKEVSFIDASPWHAPPHCMSRRESPLPPGSAAPNAEHNNSKDRIKTM
jgi:hypothetical protein